MKNTHSNTNSFILIIGIIFIAFNLRPSITSVGPLIGVIRTDLHISNGVAGMITTLPLIAFALLSLAAPKIGRKLGNELTIFISLLVLMFGIIIRSSGALGLLFLGTALIGMGIAICNVLLPAIVKQSFPLKVGIMTSVYSTSMGICAATASGISIPLAKSFGLGWQKSLLVWAIFAGIALVIWFPQLLKSKSTRPIHNTGLSSVNMLRSKLAWQVTLFMGLQSILFYCPIAWLPQILIAKGLSVEASGWMLSFMQFSGLPASFLTPMIAGKMNNQRGIVLIIGSLFFASLIGILIGGGSGFLTFCVVLLGIGQGASISLALTMLSLRAADAAQASQLSGMAQSLGYLLAAIGPILIGLLFDITLSWTTPLITLIIVTGALTVAGLGAGRNIYITGKSPISSKLGF
ncbi:CynX/NimT family MFS transporter [Lederbergia citrea]|uniref:MFS transporter n=1 Tax=Lederbergia citrea TaxID=2833581 RepID=A0A942URB8_9BACI|nr:MFS transporter [Lederbergia citrea]MBS4223533.1 MFS transporter [Lederbergia citrea]